MYQYIETNFHRFYPHITKFSGINDKKLSHLKIQCILKHYVSKKGEL